MRGVGGLGPCAAWAWLQRTRSTGMPAGEMGRGGAAGVEERSRTPPPHPHLAGCWSLTPPPS